MGIRVATSFSARQFNLLITNVPGAQKQMYIAGTKLLETYAVPPLLNNQVLAIGVTSYNGMLYFGINADRDAMSDVDVLPVAAAGIARRTAGSRAVDDWWSWLSAAVMLLVGGEMPGDDSHCGERIPRRTNR